MSTGSGSVGFGVICRGDGVVERFVRDDLQIADHFVGRSFKLLLDESSRAKGQAFLDAVRFTGAAFDWELDACLGELPQTLHFVGGWTGDGYLICGIQSRHSVLAYLEELAGINNEQANLVRDAVKQILVTRSRRLSDAGVYDEMSRLNNELVNTQRQLHKQAAQLNRMNEEKNRALGVVAHDLRNPIAILQMYSEYLILAADARLNEEERDMLRTMHQTAESMNRLVNNVLDVSSIEAGRLQLELTLIPIVPFLDGLVKRFRPIARKSGVELDLDANSSADAEINGDAGKLEQVFNNLIDNAVKFSPAGERVRLNLSSDPEYVIVRVSDRGPGIDPETQRNLFRPFVSGAARDGKGGTGLGLSIAKRIVEGHRGRIEVESSGGPGTCFRLTLPRETARVQVR